MNSSAPTEKTVHEKWLELPDNIVGEIIMGELYVSPRPAPKHSRAASSIGGELFSPFDRGNNGPGGWIILFEPEIHIDSNIFVPNVAGWRRENLVQIPDEAFFSVTPDWTCEVLSPSTAVLDRVKKMPLYAQIGIKHFWLADPVGKTLEVYEKDHGRWVLVRTYANDDKVRAVPFDAIEIDLSILWS
ncbi:MAG: Uma2 family endonuclease [Pseudobdellovibrionaceae bacterium]